MSKYLCGICTIGVKHKGILCTGGCNKWYHSKCLNWTDKKLKNLSKTEIELWHCTGCYSKTQSSDNMNEPQIENTPQSPTIEAINSKLSNYNMEDIDLETSLTLAAEVGNTLLMENTLLKEKINKLTLTNSNLAFKIKNLEKQNVTCLEEQIEELINEKQVLMNTNNTLVERLNEAEKQLNKEKHFRSELINNFEEHDNDKENTITKLKQDTQTLHNEINCLKQELLTNHSRDTKHYNNMETQTTRKEENEHNISSFLVKMLTEIKIKQENMDLSLKLLIDCMSQEHLKHNDESHIIPTDKKNTCLPNQHKNEPAKLSKEESNPLASGNRQYCNKKLQNSCNTLTIAPTIPNRCKTPSNRQTYNKNLYSISLQVAKSAAKDGHQQKLLPNPAQKTILSNSPPMHAKLRLKEETYEDFFSKHIGFYEELISGMSTTVVNSTPPSQDLRPQSVTQTQTTPQNFQNVSGNIPRCIQQINGLQVNSDFLETRPIPKEKT